MSDGELRVARCAVSAVEEQLAGTAATDHAHLLVEHAGPWGRKAWEESDLPQDVRDWVAAAAATAGVRLHLIRRHGRASAGRPGGTGTTPLTVWAAHTRPGNAWLGSKRLGGIRELLDLDLAAIGGGEPAGFEPHPGPMFLVCTNGRRDACCAELGRPVAKALSNLHPEETWESTHLGGHRFAGAVLVLPSGLSYGRLDPTSAATVAASSLRGTLEASYLRGRSSHPKPVQAAEIALLRHLGERRIDALSLVGAVPHDTGFAVTFRHERTEHVVLAHPDPGPAVRTSCIDVDLSPTSSWQTRVQPAGSNDVASSSNTSP